MANTRKDEKAIETARGLSYVPWCEDYEKMISGMLYDTTAPALTEARLKARRFMHKYNHYFPDDATADSLVRDREEMMKGVFGSMGKGVYVEPPINIDYGSNIIIGDGFYSNFNLVILDCAIVTIGNRVKFGPFVSIFAATHETEVQSRRDGIEFAKPVTIGDDCWIGGNVTIMPGVTIGKGCTVGAGSVVTKDIPDFSVAVGSPARVVKKVTPLPDL
ncbi:hypothetical protein DL766_001797 [Monosporascus sp. MC13-8B]|uniref:Maltose/galactoside acetyltransferase domain-containing protein n=1 Tax=Monosporascus cannonballus TaxID=155416 RepID=A0ABY0HHE1_9PEZI|nr:hypothetical protein DL763_008594 [Monosporascus cannonballus]RYO92667.1 hypothetical protein DL762_001570 [Monosporascus cannonballus]RYP36761.1 hypothetical protein DL766_001797 [Monosporascus sp. MC13-8B]